MVHGGCSHAQNRRRNGDDETFAPRPFLGHGMWSDARCTGGPALLRRSAGAGVYGMSPSGLPLVKWDPEFRRVLRQAEAVPRETIVGP